MAMIVNHIVRRKLYYHPMPRYISQLVAQIDESPVSSDIYYLMTYKLKDILFKFYVHAVSSFNLSAIGSSLAERELTLAATLLAA